MITGNAVKNQSPPWQKLAADTIRDPLELLEILKLDPAMSPYGTFNPRHFPLKVTRSFVEKINKGDWHDPLLRQVLPLDKEAKQAANFSADPVSDLFTIKQKGILQKYPGRALVITTGACGIHCRYCFRQHFPYSQQQANPGDWQAVMQALQADNTITEVILSGGDPLSLADKRLHSLCLQINAIEHVKQLRIHTRQPVVLPERVDKNFACWFKQLTVKKIVVIHANHANEFCSDVREALQRLQASGATLLNQSVLLKGVNDSADSLVELSKTLFDYGVLPYYLHMLDRVQGAAHFEVDEATAIRLIEQVRERLPGYLVPKLVREISGKRSKTPLI